MHLEFSQHVLAVIIDRLFNRKNETVALLNLHSVMYLSKLEGARKSAYLRQVK